MAKKITAKDVMKPHSEAKVNFYQKYLETHLLILSCVSYIREIHIYDLFCGRGVYADGKTGSAIRAYETIRKVREARPSTKKIVLHLNDKKESYTNSVRQYIESHYTDSVSICQVRYTHKDANAMLDNIVSQSWNYRTHNDCHKVFFIDPYGYKDIKRTLLEQILKTGQSEVLLFLPISFMHRFTRHALSPNATPGAMPLRDFITSYYPYGHPMASGQTMDVQQYIDSLTQAFSCGGRFYTTSYPIERNAKNHFALFFFCTSIFAFEKVLEMKWRMIDSDGFGFHLPCQQPGLFDDIFKQEHIDELTELFETKLIAYLMEGKRSNREIYEFAIKKGFLPKHAKDLLRRLQQEYKLDIIDTSTGEIITLKNCFHIDYKGYKKPNYIFITK